MIAAALLVAVDGAAAAEDWTLRPAEHLMWKRTARADTAQGYHEYLSLWPDGEHAPKALERWIDLTHRGDPKLMPLPPEGNRRDQFRL
jgi:hypothetical protein